MPQAIDNRLAVFVHGNYLPAELADDDQKFHLFAKLLGQWHDVELEVAQAVAKELAETTRLPPIDYSPGSGAIHTGFSGARTFTPATWPPIGCTAARWCMWSRTT